MHFLLSFGIISVKEKLFFPKITLYEEDYIIQNIIVKKLFNYS